LTHRLYILIILLGLSYNLSSQEHDQKYYDLGYKLLYASDIDSIAEVKNLIETQGADVNFYNEDGVTALMFASQAGYDTIVNYLISKDANVNAKSRDFNFTPLISAVKNDYLFTAEILIRSGAIIDDQDAFSRTALHYATMYGYEATADMLLYYEASTEISDVVGYTPICYSVEKKFNALTNILLSNNAQINVYVRDSSDLFHLAAGAGNLHFIKRIKDKFILRKNNDSLTAVDVSVVSGHSEILKWFVDNGYFPSDTINGIYTPRTLSRSSGDRTTKKTIKKMGISDIYYPYFRRAGMGFDMIFNGNDFFMTFSGAITEDRYGFTFETGIMFRANERRILFPIANNEFYQLRERRNAWYFSTQKDFKLFNIGFDSYVSVFCGLRGTYYWGKYDGITQRVAKSLIASPLIGINVNVVDEFRAYFYCDYLNIGIYGTPPLFYSLGFKAFIDFRKDETNEKYKYIIKY